MLDETEGRNDVDQIDVLQDRERVRVERRLGRRPEDTRVVHKEVEATQRRRRGDELGPVSLVGDVAGYRPDRHAGGDDGELVGGELESIAVAGVDDDIPPVSNEVFRERPPEPSRSACDHCNRHRFPPSSEFSDFSK